MGSKARLISFPTAHGGNNHLSPETTVVMDLFLVQGPLPMKVAFLDGHFLYSGHLFRATPLSTVSQNNQPKTMNAKDLGVACSGFLQSDFGPPKTNDIRNTSEMRFFRVWRFSEILRARLCGGWNLSFISYSLIAIHNAYCRSLLSWLLTNSALSLPRELTALLCHPFPA
jgi:hypothetical protein